VGFSDTKAHCKKGLFEHKLTLGFILLTFVDAKWTKFKLTFTRTFKKIGGKL
jgi:hypothetical protein